MAEMWIWDFGVPDLVLFEDGSVMASFDATELDHARRQLRVRIRIDSAVRREGASVATPEPVGHQHDDSGPYSQIRQVQVADERRDV